MDRQPAEPMAETNELTTTLDDPIDDAAARWSSAGWGADAYFPAALTLLRADNAIRDHENTIFRSVKLTSTRHEALAVIFFSRRGEMSLSRLSERLLVHPASITSLVDGLERLGYLERVRHPSDRRAVLARLSPTGRRVFRSTSRALAKSGSGLAALTRSAAEEVFELLRPLRHEAGDLLPDEHGLAHDPVLVAEGHWERHGWSAPSHFRASLSIYRTAAIVREANANVFQPHGLTHVRHEALTTVYLSNGMSMSMRELAHYLQVHPTTVTSTVDSLERLGYAARAPHPHDRRAVLIELTPAGRRMIERVNESLGAERFGLGALGAREADRVRTLLAGVLVD